MKRQKFLQRGLPATPATCAGGRGQTLLEILLAFSISVLVLSAIVIGVTGSLNNANFTKNQNLANAYVQEGMAVVRQIRDSNWKNFISTTPDIYYCLGSSNTWVDYDGLECRTVDKIGIFTRKVTLVQESDDCEGGSAGLKGTMVNAIVSWSDSKCPAVNLYCHNVELVSCFSNIDQREGP